MRTFRRVARIGTTSATNRQRPLARDGGDTDLAARYLDKASGFVATHRFGATHSLEIREFHSGMMARDSGRSFCPTIRSRGATACESRKVAQGWTLLAATTPQVRFSVEQPFPRRAGSLVEWRTVPAGAKPADQRWWARSAGTVRSGTLVVVVVVTERVKAPTQADADQQWAFAPAALRRIATDPGLTFTAPPKDPSNGCDWVAPRYRKNIECNGPFSDPEGEGGR